MNCSDRCRLDEKGEADRICCGGKVYLIPEAYKEQKDKPYSETFLVKSLCRPYRLKIMVSIRVERSGFHYSHCPDSPFIHEVFIYANFGCLASHRISDQEVTAYHTDH